MINVLYRTGNYPYLTRNKNVVGGMIATFSGNREVDICTNKTLPIGFFSQDFTPESHETAFTERMLAVLIGQGEYQTDVFEKPRQTATFEKNCVYRLNDLLYCSCNGKITNEEYYRGGVIVGIVNYVSDDLIGFIAQLHNLESLNKSHQFCQEPPIRINRYDIALDKATNGAQ